MQPLEVSKRTIGVNLHQGAARINIWAPPAKTVSLVAGDLEIPLQKRADGYWQGATEQLKEGSRYKIKIDDQPAVSDPASLSQPDGVHGDSAVVDLDGFQWDNEWTNPPLEEYIIYELHVGTFTPEGTFAALEEKLPYLKELGITAIEIMPVAQFPGNRNWGYDGVFPFAVQHSYGGAKGLQSLVNTSHRHGLAVILDVVYNHLGPEGNYLGAYGPFFTDKYGTPWGNAINFDDAWSDGVRRFFIENALMWFRDFGIDALRLDAVHAIKDFSAVHLLKEIRLRADELMQQTGKTHFLIVELDLNDTRFIDPVQKGGFGMDAQWIDEFHHALRVATGQPKTGYYADFNGLEDLAKAYRDAYVYDGQWSPHRKRHFGVKATENPGRQFIVFSQNHDQVGNRMLGERTSELLGFELQKLMAAAVVLSPFLPMLFMGEEWSETNPFLYFVSHTDPELAEAVRKGRKAEFAAFHAKGEAPDPMAEETFTRSKLQWNLQHEGKHQTILQYYKALLALRKSEPAFKNLDRQNSTVTANTDNQTLLMHRWHQDSKIVCLLNFSGEPAVVHLDQAAAWMPVLDSADPTWGGPGTAVTESDTVRLQPHSILVLRQQ